MSQGYINIVCAIREENIFTLFTFTFFNPNLQFGFWKGFNAQDYLLVLVEKRREVLDMRGYAGMLYN